MVSFFKFKGNSSYDIHLKEVLKSLRPVFEYTKMYKCVTHQDLESVDLKSEIIFELKNAKKN